MNRREAIKKSFCGVLGLTAVTTSAIGECPSKDKVKGEEPVDGKSKELQHNREEIEDIFLSTSWNYIESNKVLSYRGLDFRIYNFEVEYGMGVTSHFCMNIVRDWSKGDPEESKNVPVNKVDIRQVSSCNVRDGRIEYINSHKLCRESDRQEFFSPEHDKYGNTLLTRIRVREMKVNLFSPTGDVIAILHKDQENCWVEWKV